MSNSSQCELPAEWKQLMAASREARQRAYAPYSNYAVGAAILTARRQIFSGCNIENSSYGLTICAERVATASAVASGQQELVAVCVSLTGTAVPCGTCRQFLYEFNPEMLVLLDDLTNAADHPPECIRLAELLPRGFRLKEQ